MGHRGAAVCGWGERPGVLLQPAEGRAADGHLSQRAVCDSREAQLLVLRAQRLSGQAAERRQLRAAAGCDDARDPGRIAAAAERYGAAVRVGSERNTPAKQGYVELIDGDTANAYAWLAVGRFSLAALNPSDAAKKQQLAAEIIGKLKLAALRPQLATLVAAPNTDGAARAAIGQALRVARARQPRRGPGRRAQRAGDSRPTCASRSAAH